MLTLDSNGSWIGNDLWNDLNKSQKAYFYWLLPDLTVVKLAIHMLHASPVLNNTSATVEGLADSDSSGPLPTSFSVPHSISLLGYKELV
jgi:hypothetical protein